MKKQHLSSRAGLLSLTLAALVSLPACTSFGSDYGALERWNMEEQDVPEQARTAAVGNSYANPYCPGQAPSSSVVDESLAQPITAVFYRDPPPATNQGNPLNVYINGHYQASLVGNTFTVQQLRPGEHRLMVAFNDAERRYVSKDAGQVFKVGQSAIQYFRISADENAAAARIAAVDADAGKAALQGRMRQDHTVPRVLRSKCPTL